MLFKCQDDSYLKEFETTVVSCLQGTFQLPISKEIRLVGEYDVVLEDTILFPEGGGQPYDVGWIDGKEVVGVYRIDNKAVHFLKEPVEVGSVVQVKLDWNRRFDHMQQHSGQHLLSAILEKEHNTLTTSWWLGEDECYVELDTRELSADIIKSAEERCNALIRESVPMSVKICEKNDPELLSVRKNNVPEDQTDNIRIVKIEGIDVNLCCGTHVSNTSELQVIKFLKVESGKKNKVNLRFIVGNRVISRLQKSLEREQELTGFLKCDAKKHVSIVDRLQRTFKSANKAVRCLSLDIAELEVKEMLSRKPLPLIACYYKKDASLDYVKALLRGFEKEKKLFVFVAIGDNTEGGSIHMMGDSHHLKRVSELAQEVLKAKGNCTDRRYQGRAEDMTLIEKCFDIAKQYFYDLERD